MTVLDGATAEIGGLTCGFVGGGLRTAYRTPYTYDVVSRRFERGSVAVLEAIRQTSPRLMLFGHVHNPLVARMRIGRTECVNVGHFRARETPYVLQL